MPILQFVKNTGQVQNHLVAYVAKVTDDFEPMYKGADAVELLREGLDIVGFKNVGEKSYYNPQTGGSTYNGVEFKEGETERAECLDEAFPGTMHAYSSCYEIVVYHGTAAAAFLNATVNR